MFRPDPATLRGSALAALLILAAGGSSGASAQRPAPTCDEPHHQAFDFWVGEWEVFLPDGSRAGENRIEKRDRGCTLVESWTSANGGTGTSINYYDPALSEWVQLWVSPGTVIKIQGGLVDGAMVLEGEIIGSTGSSTPFRGRWTPNADGSVRQHFEIDSGPDGWSTWFDGRYVRK